MASIAKKIADSSRIFRIYSPRLYCTGSKGSDSSKTESTVKSDKTEKTTKTKPKEPETVAAAPEVFDNTKYCVPEYYQYNEMSFYDIDRDMANFRLPQQSKY